MGISWQDRVTNQDVLRKADMSGVEAILLRAHLRWTGHVVRMEDGRIPKQLLYSELATGHRHQGGQIKRYRDMLKTSLVACNIPIDTWEEKANDRNKWRKDVTEGSIAFETKRLNTLDDKRLARKSRTSTSDPTAAVYCPTCGKLCASAFGLRAHQRRH